MAQQERKDREQRTTQTDADRNAQAKGPRNELTWRDPLAALWRDPFGSFWHDPFSLLQREQRRNAAGVQTLWTPQIESFQRGDQFVVRADLPGMKKDDVDIELTDDALTIEGERREEREEEHGGYYRTERSYGSFYRVVPLPEGAITETAKASFNNGVLEITLQAPPKEVSRKRRVEIMESADASRKNA